ncbi:hypothetical protein D3C72_1715010 [compost metagenome]
MHHVVRRHAQAVVSMGENLARRFVGAGLFRGDDAINMSAQLGDVARNDLIVCVRDDA